MKRHLFASILIVASVAGGSVATAQTEAPANSYRNRFGLSYRMGFNISGKFENLGGIPARAIADARWQSRVLMMGTSVLIVPAICPCPAPPLAVTPRIGATAMPIRLRWETKP